MRTNYCISQAFVVLHQLYALKGSENDRILPYDLSQPKYELFSYSLNSIGENYNHGIDADNLIYGENFDREKPETLTPLTKARFDLIVKRIKERDEYATI